MFLFIIINTNIIGQQRFISLFEPIDYSSISSRNNIKIKNAVVAKINQSFLDEVSLEGNSIFTTSVPLNNYGDKIDLDLVQFELVNDEFDVLNSDEESVEYLVGKYFSAISKDKSAMGAFSFYHDKIMGLLSFKDGVVYNIGEISDETNRYIIYRDVDFDTGLSFYCDTDDKYEKIDDLRDIEKIVKRGNKCINLYAEADYALYIKNGKSISRTVDFVLGLFAESALLYKKEGVNIKVAKIKVWDTKDNYSTKASHEALNQFVEKNKNKDMDLGLLLALGAQGLGGVAFIKGLCTQTRHFAYANITDSYNNVPAYSWSAMVITHELGHNLGSRHTHSCSWNGDHSQIDDCGNLYYYKNGETPEGKSCFDENNPIIPADGGTIMSYCHLIGAAGINLSKGFGDQPNKVINRVVDNAECLDVCSSYGDSNPVAKFDAFKDFTCVGGQLKFYDKSANHPNEWIWVFENENGVDTAYHKYPKMRYNDLGTYDVGLIAINGVGRDTLFKEDYIKVIEGPTADFEYEFIEKNRVKFTNQSKLSNSYFWRFGDGLISLGRNPKHKYREGGKYLVELWANRDTCSTKAYYSDTIEVKIPYKARFSTSNRNVCIGDTVVFRPLNENYDSVKWNFENGLIIDDIDGQVSVLYQESGDFSVKMIAFSQYGNDTLTKGGYVRVLSSPISDFEYTISNDTIFLINESLNSTGYIWYFDGTKYSFSANPIYKFDDKSEVTVKLIAINKCDSSVSVKNIITTAVEEYDNVINVHIYPNPNSGEFRFVADKIYRDKDVLQIYNVYGNLVYKKTFLELKKVNGEYIVDIKGLKSGLYYMSILSDKNIICKKAFSLIKK